MGLWICRGTESHRKRRGFLEEHERNQESQREAPRGSRRLWRHPSFFAGHSLLAIRPDQFGRTKTDPAHQESLPSSFGCFGMGRAHRKSWKQKQRDQNNPQKWSARSSMFDCQALKQQLNDPDDRPSAQDVNPRRRGNLCWKVFVRRKTGCSHV